MGYSIQPTIFLHQEKSHLPIPSPYYRWTSEGVLFVNDAPYKKLWYVGAGCALVISTVAYLNIKPSHLLSSGAYGSLTPQTLLTKINTARALQGLPPFVDNPLLDTVAQAKATDMARRQYYSHTDPQGETIFQSMHQEIGGFSSVGETLSLGFTTPQDVVSAWATDPASERTLDSELFTSAGIGIARGTWRDGSAATFVVLEAGADENQF